MGLNRAACHHCGCDGGNHFRSSGRCPTHLGCPGYEPVDWSPPCARCGCDYQDHSHHGDDCEWCGNCPGFVNAM